MSCRLVYQTNIYGFIFNSESIQQQNLSEFYTSIPLHQLAVDDEATTMISALNLYNSISDSTIVTTLSLAGMHVQTDPKSYGMGLLEVL